MSKAILTMNAGSSSIKFCLFSYDSNLTLLAGGRVTDILERRTGRTSKHAGPDRRQTQRGHGRSDKRASASGPVFVAKAADEESGEQRTLPQFASHEDAVDAVLSWLQEGVKRGKPWQFSTVAHRIVHGGTRFAEPVHLTSPVIAYLETLCPLAPLHQAHNLVCVKILAEKNMRIQQYGCFDTAFHARRDPIYTAFALPEELREKGVRRYGFHGLSYDWIAHCLHRDYPRLAKGRVVVAHLGNGASLCAMREGKCVDTTMGLSTLDGLPMGTRCGGIDPGALLYMQRALRLTVEEVAHVLYYESGLKGLSGISNDVKTLSESSSPEAKFALDYFALKTAQQVAAMAVALGGMDALIFTGGIGENAEGIRKAIQKQLTFLPSFETHVIPANEERGMAQSIYQLFGKKNAAA